MLERWSGLVEGIREEIIALVMHGGGGLGWSDAWSMTPSARRAFAEALRREAEARAKAVRQAQEFHG